MKKRRKTKEISDLQLFKLVQANRKRRKKRAASKPSAKKGDVRRSVGKKHARNPKKSGRGIRRRG